MSKLTAFIHLDMYEKDGDARFNVTCHGEIVDMIIMIAHLKRDQPILFEKLDDPFVQKIMDISKKTDEEEAIVQ